MYLEERHICENQRAATFLRNYFLLGDKRRKKVGEDGKETLNAVLNNNVRWDIDGEIDAPRSSLFTARLPIDSAWYIDKRARRFSYVARTRGFFYGVSVSAGRHGVQASQTLDYSACTCVQVLPRPFPTYLGGSSKAIYGALTLSHFTF